jgi:hypothetical protein
MIDLQAETVISLSQAARTLPPGRRGKPVTLSCVLRWVLNGVKGPSCEKVRLEAIRVGSRWLTSREAIQRFADRLTPRLDAASPALPRSAAQRQRASERAARELHRIGI